MNNWILYALAIFPLLGLLLLGKGARDVWRGVASTQWPQTTGIVIGTGESIGVETPSRTSAYQTLVTASYRVDGQEYKTNTLYFGQSAGTSDPSEIEMARLRYPKGTEVAVSYNPQKPSLAALKPGFTAEVLTVPAIGVALTLVGILLMVAYQTSTLPHAGMNPLIPRLFSSVFVLVGVILLTPGLRNLSRARVSVTWPQAPGVVIFTKMTSSTSVTRDADGIKSRRTSYNSPLVVEYEVNGTKHYTNKRCFGQLAGADAEWAHKIAKHYPVGSKIPVAYSPTDPDFAVVEPGLSTEAYWLPGAGAAFFLFGLAVLLVFRF